MDKYSLKPRIFSIKFKNISEDYISNKPIIIKIIIVVQESIYFVFYVLLLFLKNLAY